MSQVEPYNPAASRAYQQTSTAATASSTLDANGPKTTYSCAECGDKVDLGRADLIRCRNCGHRVLYKMRTTRMVQFEAR